MGELGQCMHREHGSILRRCSLGRLHRRHLLLREMPIIWCPGACPPPTIFDHRREKLRLLARPPSRRALGAAACKEC